MYSLILGYESGNISFISRFISGIWLFFHWFLQFGTLFLRSFRMNFAVYIPIRFSVISF